jgi:hypothetical protein
LFAGQDADDEKAQAKLLSCFGNQGVSKGRDFCDQENPGTERADVFSQINCYDNNDIGSIEVCKIKADFYYWSNTRLNGCYKNQGYVLDKEFCDSQFPLISQIDTRYECFT